MTGHSTRCASPMVVCALTTERSPNSLPACRKRNSSDVSSQPSYRSSPRASPSPSTAAKRELSASFLYDLLPRLVTALEWDRITERGLVQRITALNLFLRDVYFDAKILHDQIVPRELVYSCKHYRRQMRGLQVPRNIYIAVVGSDLLRLNSGEFVVLEDNGPACRPVLATCSPTGES